MEAGLDGVPRRLPQRASVLREGRGDGSVLSGRARAHGLVASGRFRILLERGEWRVETARRAPACLAADGLRWVGGGRSGEWGIGLGARVTTSYICVG